MTLTICTASGADRFIKVDAQGIPVADHDGAGEAHYGCSFMPVAGVVPLLLALVLLLPLVWRRRLGWTLYRVIDPTRPDITAAHGARAPPAFA